MNREREEKHLVVDEEKVIKYLQPKNCVPKKHVHETCKTKADKDNNNYKHMALSDNEEVEEGDEYYKMLNGEKQSKNMIVDNKKQKVKNKKSAKSKILNVIKIKMSMLKKRKEVVRTSNQLVKES